MTSRWIGTLLIAATALTPIAAQAQDAFGAQLLAEARAAAARATSGGIQPVDVPASNLRQTPPVAAPAPTGTDSADFQRDGRRGGGGGDGRRGGGGWTGRGGPAATPAPTPAPSPRADGGWGRRGGTPDVTPAPTPAPRADRGWGRRDGGGGDGQYSPRGDVRVPADRTGDYRRGGRDRVTAPPVATPPPAPADRGDRYDRRDGRGGDARRGGGGFGDRVIGDAERRNGGDRYSGRRGDGDRYDRRDNDDRRYDGNRWDRRDGDRRYGDRRYDNGRGYGRDHNRWDRDWRRDNRYDWQSYRSRYSSHYRLPSYYSPYRDWNYRRLSIGFSLWPLFYSERYWINDPWYYRLPDVYGPYRWVRYYDDALLVDIGTGEVVDVIENFFW